MPFFDDAEISKRHKDRIRAMEGEAKENLTLAQRLTMRALKRTITITLPANEGEEEIPLKFYVPAGDEWSRLHTLLIESVKCNLDTPEGQDRMKDIQDEVFTTLADLSLDVSLTKEFWADEKNYAANEPTSTFVLGKLMEAVNKLTKDGGSFRSNKNGKSVD
jgi:hypothetical protein